MITVIDAEQRKEDRLYDFAKAAMQAIIRITPMKAGPQQGFNYTLDCKVAWGMAIAMMKQKEELDALANGPKSPPTRSNA